MTDYQIKITTLIIANNSVFRLLSSVLWSRFHRYEPDSYPALLREAAMFTGRRMTEDRWRTYWPFCLPFSVFCLLVLRSRHELTTAMQHLCFTLEGHTFPCACRSMSSPGKVPRLPSNWTTWSTACAGPRLFLWVLALRPYFPGGALNGFPYENDTERVDTSNI